MNILVKCADGKSMLDPLTNRMITSSECSVRASTYIRRRIADGDLILCDAKVTKKIKKEQVQKSALEKLDAEDVK